jgi:predicted ATPase
MSHVPINLPAQLTSLVDREADVAQVHQQLLDPAVRLLTVTGPAGIGKTRLALQAAAGLSDTFRDGIFVVALGLINHPDLVPSMIAQTIGIRDAGSQPPFDSLTR